MFFIQENVFENNKLQNHENVSHFVHGPELLRNSHVKIHAS